MSDTTEAAYTRGWNEAIEAAAKACDAQQDERLGEWDRSNIACDACADARDSRGTRRIPG